MAGQRDICIFDDRDGAARFVVEKWVEIFSTANAETGRFVAALSGGRTPVDFYERLSACHKPLPWEKTHIFLADERFVPHSDRESNYRLIKEHLLDHLAIPKQNLHPVITGEGTPDDAARRYEEEIRQFFALGAGQLPVFDLMLLGMGEDGHTASLFPGAASLKEKTRLAISVITDRIPRERISLTLPVINGAKHIIVLVNGKNKAIALKEILENKDSSLPAAGVFPRHGVVYFVMDKAAAGLLSDAVIGQDGM